MKGHVSIKNNNFNATQYLIYNENIKKGRGNKVALYYDDSQVTYNKLYDEINKYGYKLKKMGFNSNSRIGIMLPDIKELVYIFFGAMKCNMTPILINEKFDQSQLDYIIKDSKIDIIILQRKNENIIKCDLEKVIFIEDLAMNNGINEIEIKNQIEDDINVIRDYKPCFWVYTSGSTGNPKGVVHYQQNMKICIDNYGKNVLEMKSGDIMYSVSKMAHTYGLGNSTFQTFGVGAASIISETENIFQIVENINRYKPTVFCAVPTVYLSLLRISEVESINMDSIRLFISAGEVLPKSIWEKWKDKFGHEIIDGIGTTEVLTTFISNKPGNVIPGSAGKVVHGYDVKIINNNMEAPDLVEGSLAVYGETLMKEYNQVDAKYYFSDNKKYLITGDRFYKDEKGNLWYCGRDNQLFKVNGRWVKSAEVEDVLLQIDYIREAFVLDENNDNQTTTIVAYILLDKEISFSKQIVTDIKKYVKKRIEHYKCPSKLYFVKKIPKGPTNKIRRLKIDKELIEYTS